ncbi:MAG: Yip1 family protein [Dehalococcoidales bacterium]|nr:Yip1 family protein [Dehalococcoidales bacterium]
MQEGIFETLIGILIRPTPTIRSICQQRPIGWAVVIYLVICLVSAVAAIGLGFFEEAGLPGLGRFSIAVYIPGMLVGTPIIGLLALVVSVAIYHLVALVLGGKGSYSGLFSGFAFAALPSIFSAPLAVISLPLGIVGTMLYSLGSIGLSLWVVVLYVIALRENYAVSTGRAILILLLPAVFFVLLVLLVALVITALIGGLP